MRHEPLISICHSHPRHPPSTHILIRGAHFDLIVNAALEGGTGVRDPVQQRILVALDGVGQRSARDSIDNGRDAIPGRNLLGVQHHQRLNHRHVRGHPQRIRLDEDRLRQLDIVQLVQGHALPRQRLQDGPVV